MPLYRCGHDHDSFRHRFPAPVRLGLIKSGSLTNREIEKLDAFLLSDGGLENAMDVSTLDGFLCAVPIDDRNWSPLRPMLWDCFKSRRRLEAEILVLRHQLNVLQQRTPRRLYLRWAVARCSFGSIVAALIKPETVVRWHRMGFAAYWRWKSRSKYARSYNEMRTHVSLGKDAPAHARSSGSEMLLRIQFLADSPIDTHESSLQKRHPCLLI